MSETPDEAELLSELAAAIKGSMNACLPAKVLAYDLATQTVTVRPAIMGRWHNPETDTLLPVPLPIISNVPVAFPSGGGCSITWPLLPNDDVMLVFADRSIEEWKSTGAPENLPQDIRRFDLTDAICIPGLKPPATPIGPEGVAASGLVIAGLDIRLGSSNATDFVALASKVLTELAAIKARYDVHTHVSAAPGSPTGPPVPLLDVPGNVGATKVKAE